MVGANSPLACPVGSSNRFVEDVSPGRDSWPSWCEGDFVTVIVSVGALPRSPFGARTVRVADYSLGADQTPLARPFGDHSSSGEVLAGMAGADAKQAVPADGGYRL